MKLAYLKVLEYSRTITFILKLSELNKATQDVGSEYKDI